MSNANLSWANLSDAYLAGANLAGANLSKAHLSRANLSRANLSSADLTGANLFKANLTWANLSNANLSNADLSNADLSRANLAGANLSKANLSKANLTGAILPDFKLTPDTGVFTGWEKVSGNVILELEIIGERNSSLVGRKCRTNKAKVVEAYNPNGSVCTEKEFRSLYDRNFKYVVGETICEPEYNSDIRVECTRGIHFFVTRKEAEGY
jgi:uncharacterized protein YjbI with pentapeptide repeats